jgi:hypothetical protein
LHGEPVREDRQRDPVRAVVRWREFSARLRSPQHRNLDYQTIFRDRCSWYEVGFVRSSASALVADIAPSLAGPCSGLSFAGLPVIPQRFYPHHIVLLMLPSGRTPRGAVAPFQSISFHSIVAAAHFLSWRSSRAPWSPLLTSFSNSGCSSICSLVIGGRGGSSSSDLTREGCRVCSFHFRPKVLGGEPPVCRIYALIYSLPSSFTLSAKSLFYPTRSWSAVCVNARWSVCSFRFLRLSFMMRKRSNFRTYLIVISSR